MPSGRWRYLMSQSILVRGESAIKRRLRPAEGKNMLSKVLRSTLVLPVLMVFGMVGASAATTDTGSNMTITVPSKATLTARVGVEVTVQVSCSAPDLSAYTLWYPATVFYNSGSVTVSQAAGNSVAHANAGFGPITCDGNTYPYSLYMEAGSVPFHPGPAARSEERR